MSRALRIVLCLCLLLDSLAPGLAASRMHAQADAAEQAQPAPSSDCHGAGEAPAGPATAPGECLQQCLDLCLQQGHALGGQALSMGSPGADRAPPAAASPQAPSVRAFPPLRPPIA